MIYKSSQSQWLQNDLNQKFKINHQMI